MTDITVDPLTLADAHELAPLVAAYAQDRTRGAPRRPDEYYSELLLKDRTAEIIGARREGRLIGFAVYFDLPNTLTGMRAGQLDDLFVIQDAREHGVGRALIAALAAEGERRGWTELRWMVPERPPQARQLAEKLAEHGGRASYMIRIERRSE
jgi:GNAT superfamily N-acetyltransferase